MHVFVKITLSDRSVTRRALTSVGAPELLSLVARSLPAM